MRQPAATLEAFYKSRLGEAAAQRMGARMLDLWGPCDGQRVLGIGFPAPLLTVWQNDAATCIGAVPEEIGEVRLASEKGQTLCSVPENRLPFPEGLFDRVFLLHALEEADSPRQMLREAWRVLAPEGRIVVAVTNRRSMWSLADNKPFGHGRPWTRQQLVRFLNDSLFQVTASTTAVHMPPLDWRLITGASKSWERAGELILPGLGGVVLVEAVKRLYSKPGGSAAAPVTQAVKASKPKPVMPRKLAGRDAAQSVEKTAIDVLSGADRRSVNQITGAGET
ncbi:MAG: methyltransferase domain-containing protein [Henriciella sp.]|nr:methyltransferase domain-containing protein [Henriciella sp.]